MTRLRRAALLTISVLTLLFAPGCGLFMDDFAKVDAYSTDADENEINTDTVTETDRTAEKELDGGVPDESDGGADG